MTAAIAPDLPQLSTESELVVYRVAQERLQALIDPAQFGLNSGPGERRVSPSASVTTGISGVPPLRLLP